MNQHIVKAEEMNDYGRLVFKLAVINDVFEMKDLAALLRKTTEFSVVDGTFYMYLKGQRTPPPGFSDQVRRALKLNDNMYHLLLYVYDKTTGRLSPAQREQTAAFERLLLEIAARGYLGNGDEAAN